MAEHLTVPRYRNSDQIPNITDNTVRVKSETGTFVAYRNNPANAKDYGYRYKWYAVDDSRGITPIML